MSRVVVLGGGVAGMSAAHELAERGFEVTVFERQEVPGGKARSLRVVEPFQRNMLGGKAMSGPRYRSKNPWLPGEHGFRFFPGFYRHVVDTMQRIPEGGRTVAHHLVATSECHHARFGKRGVYLPARFPQRPGDLKTMVNLLVDWWGGQLEVDTTDTLFFTEKLWQIMTSCEERRFAEYEKIDWWAFTGAAQRSPAYQKVFANAITRSLVAAKAERASTKTIGDIFVQIVLDILDPGVDTADRVLDGPTNEVWIDPWLSHLRSLGVEYHFDTSVRAFHLQAGRIKSVTLERGGKTWDVSADYFVAALPVERMAELVTPELTAAEPALGHLTELSRYVEWMNGIQFYLTKDVPLVHGHSIYVDSPWALTSVSQAQFWRDFDLRQYGDGTIRGILSVDISDWDVPGLNGKEADECTREEIAAETWRQLKQSLNVDGVEVLKDEHLHSWFLDPDIVDLDPNRPGIELNREPLLVNYVDTWRLRPEATLAIPNLFLASDYVRTHTDLATMEAANEAARRAVNGLLAASGSSQPPCSIWRLHEPPLLAPFRAYDRLRFQQGLPWDFRAPAVADAARRLLATLQSASNGVAGGQAPLELPPRLLEDLARLAAVPPAPLAGPSAPLAGPSAPLAGPSAPLAGPSAPLAEPPAPACAAARAGGIRIIPI